MFRMFQTLPPHDPRRQVHPHVKSAGHTATEAVPGKLAGFKSLVTMEIQIDHHRSESLSVEPAINGEAQYHSCRSSVHGPSRKAPPEEIAKNFSRLYAEAMDLLGEPSSGMVVLVGCGREQAAKGRHRVEVFPS